MLASAALHLALAGSSILAFGSQETGFAFGGRGDAAAQRLRLTITDANGREVAGSATTYHLVSSDDKDLSIAEVAGEPGLFTLVPLAQSKGTITLTATAALGGRDRRRFRAVADLQLDAILYVGNAGNNTVTAFAPWSSAPILSIASPQIADPVAMTVDAPGNLFVANYLGDSIVEFAPGNALAVRTIAGLAEPIALTIDPAGNLYVSNYGNDTVEEFGSDARAPLRTLSRATSPSGIDIPGGLAIDGAGNLFVANWDEVGVSIYPQGDSTTPATAFSTGMSNPWTLAFDSTGNLYVGNHSGQNVTQYRAPFTAASPVIRTFGASDTVPDPDAIAVDDSGNVYVANGAGGKVVEFAPDGSIVRSLPGGTLTRSIAVDALGNVFVPDDTGSAVRMYAAALTGIPVRTITTGLSEPVALALWP